MDFFQTFVLALIQGLTEFLPVSSSAHLILPSQVLGWKDQGLAFDVSVHLGTLIAVIIYFRNDLMSIVRGVKTAALEKQMNQDAGLGLAIVVGVLPAMVVGALFHEYIETNLRSAWVVACSTIVFGLVLWVADRQGKRTLGVQEMNLSRALIIGCAQVLAFIPGTSRSGITITAALFLGFDRIAAARFSMLLSIPIIIAAATLESYKVFVSGVAGQWGVLLTGALVAAISAYLCIHYFLRFLEKVGMLPFVIYRLLLGLFLFVFLGFY